MTDLLGAIDRAESVAIITHYTPDGDALGSILALRRAFSAMGKRAVALCRDAVPSMYEFLRDVEFLQLPKNVSGEVFDLALLADVADPQRTGAESVISASKAWAVIDHHLVPPPACPHYIKREAAACGELVLEIIRAINAPIEAATAELLYVAMSADTGHFMFSNTTPQVMRAAAEMLELGADALRVTDFLYRTRTKARTLLLGRAISSIRLYGEGRVASMRLTLADYSEFDAGESDAEGIVNHAKEMQGVKAAFMARETADGVKISVRTDETVNARDICAVFGGGGHARAAGCTLDCGMESAVQRVAAALEIALRGERRV